MASYDVTVRGAGVFGLSCAWACVQRGARVQVIDPGSVGAGASGGVVGALAPHVPENWNPKKAFQLTSLLMAEDWWGQIAQISGRDPGYCRSGRLQPVADEAALALAQARALGADTLWQGRATWEVMPSGQDDWHPPSPSGWLIKDTLSALLHPRQATEALAAALRARGAVIVPEGVPQGAQIWATGAAGLTALSDQLGRAVGQPIKGQAALLRCDRAGAPQLFVDGLHIIPHLDGSVAIGSTTERDTTDLSTDAQLETLIAKARGLVPALRDAPVLARWAGLRPRARSRAPMLGAQPAQPGVFIANGGFKIGFGMAPLVGEVMADLVLDGVDRIPQGFEVGASL